MMNHNDNRFEAAANELVELVKTDEPKGDEYLTAILRKNDVFRREFKEKNDCFNDNMAMSCAFIPHFAKVQSELRDLKGAMPNVGIMVVKTTGQDAIDGNFEISHYLTEQSEELPQGRRENYRNLPMTISETNVIMKTKIINDIKADNPMGKRMVICLLKLKKKLYNQAKEMFDKWTKNILFLRTLIPQYKAIKDELMELKGTHPNCGYWEIEDCGDNQEYANFQIAEYVMNGSEEHNRATAEGVVAEN